MVNEIQEGKWEYLLDPCFELSNSAGKPLTNGWIEVYIAGSRDKYYCASDFSGTLHPFQIPLDSLGSNIVLASPDNSYDVYVYNQYGSLVMSRYNVKCQTGSGSSTYVGDKLYYGQFKATDVSTQASLTRVVGNIDVDNGKLELKQGMSYHITLRGEFVVDSVSNVDTVLSYIEYSAVKPINVNVDYTKDGSQYFEISYDIYRLAEDMDYPVSFMQSNGLVKNLVVEVHSLSNLATNSSGGSGSEYEQGWGIVIQNNTISVDPSILEEFTTTEEVMAIVSGITGVGPGEVYTAGDYISIEDNTISVTGIDPNNYVTYEFLDEAIASAVSGLGDGTIVIPIGVIDAASDSTELWDEIARIVDTNKYGVFVRLPYYENATALLWRGLLPETHDTLFYTFFLDYYGNGTATIRGEWIRGVTHRQTRSNVKYLSQVYHNVTLTGTGTMDDPLTVNRQFVPYVEDLTNAVTAVSSVLHEEITEVAGSIINYQAGEGIDITGDTISLSDPLSIEAGSGINFTTDGDTVRINADPIDLTDYVTHEELIEAVSAVTGLGEYGQFYNAACTGIAELGKVKGTLSVTNDGKVSLKQGCSYHVTVRGGVDVDPTANTYGAFGLTEFISGNSINSNIDRTIEDTQYFEISYDLYNLSADTDYEFAFTNVGGEVKALYVEIHEIGHVGSGSGGSVTGTAEYDAGWGINIVNNVISVDPSVIPEQVQSDWAETASALPSFIRNKPVEYDLVAGQNINIAVTGTNVVISSTGGSGGATYIEGFGIDIVNDEISIDPNVVALASAVNNDNLLTYGVSTWNDFRTMLDSGTNAVFVKDNYGYVSEYTYKVGTLMYYSDSDAKFIMIDDTVNGTGNGRARMYTLTSAGAWSRAYVKLAPKVDDGFGITASYNSATDIETLSINTDVVALASAIPTIELNGDSQVTAIDGHTLAGGSGGDSDTFTAEVYATSEQWGYSVDASLSTPYADVLNAYGQGKKLMVKFNVYNGTDYEFRTLLNLSEVTNSGTGFKFYDRYNGTNILFVTYDSVYGVTAERYDAQADWNASLNGMPGYIKNKPSIPEIELNSVSQVTAIDGHALAGGGATYTAGTGIDITNDEISIDNTVALKTDIPTYTAASGVKLVNNVISLDEPVQLVAGDNVSISVSGVSAVISAQGGGASYTEGLGIDITNDEISIDPSVVALVSAIPADQVVVFDDYQRYNQGTNIYRTDNALKTAFLAGKIILIKFGYYSYLPGGLGHNDETSYAICTGADSSGSNYPDRTGGKFYFTTFGGEYNKYHYDITIDLDITSDNCLTANYWSAENLAHTSDIPTVQLDSNNQVTAINNHTLAGGGGATYSAGQYISIENDTIAVTGIDPSLYASQSDLEAVSGLITPELPVVAGTGIGITETSTEITIAVTGNYVSDSDLQTAVQTVESEIPVVTGFATKTEVTAGIQAATGLIPTDINPLVTANISDIQVVNSLPGSPVSTVLYLIPEA